jgi:hypothetical protein
MELAHHLAGSDRPVLYLVAAVCALPMLVFALKLGNARA